MCFQYKILHYSDYPFGIVLGPIIIYILLHVCGTYYYYPIVCLRVLRKKIEMMSNNETGVTFTWTAMFCIDIPHLILNTILWSWPSKEHSPKYDFNPLNFS
jgi:hypothetical protein